jgi:hypothetical protein
MMLIIYLIEVIVPFCAIKQDVKKEGKPVVTCKKTDKGSVFWKMESK